MKGIPNFIYGNYDQPKHFPSPTFLTLMFVFYLYVMILGIIVILGTLWMPFFFFWGGGGTFDKINFPKT